MKTQVEEMTSIPHKLLKLLDRSDYGVMGLLFFMMVINACLEALGIGLIVPILAIVSDPERLREYAAYDWFTDHIAEPNQTNLIVASVGAMLLVYVIKNTYYVFHKNYLFKFIYQRQVRLSRTLLRAFLFKSYQYHLGKNSSELLQTVNREVQVLFNSTLVYAANIFVEGIVVLVVLAMLVIAEPAGALATGALFGVISLVFLRVIRQRAQRYGAEQQRYARDMIKWVQQGIGGIKESKVLNRELFFVDAYTESSRGYSENARRLRVITMLPRPLIETLGVAGMLLLTVIMLWRGQSMSAILPMLGLFAMSAVRLLPSVNRIVTAMTNIRGNVPVLNSVVAGLDELEEDELRERQRLAPRVEHMPFEDAIRLQDITFRYDEGDEEVLRGLTLQIRRGEVVGFVGASGAGKSTLINVLLGLLEPHAGQILVDDQDVQARLSSWQSHIGYIAQDTYLCDDSIRRNVAFGRDDDDIDDEAVWRALRVARLDDFVAEMPEGLDTLVGEQGGAHLRGTKAAHRHRPRALPRSGCGRDG